MASNETVKPKGILKHSSSLDHRDSVSHKEMTWDEMNILATHHPADKDYGHMKIDEPPTPYSKCSDVEDDEGEETRRGSVSEKGDVDPKALASRLNDNMDPKVFRHARVAEDDDGDGDEEEEEEEEEDEEQKEQRHNFELKRKLHYNEYQAVQLAKKLMSEEEEEDEDEEEEGNETNNMSDKMDLSSPPISDKLT